MGVEVDEAGRHDQSVGVDDPPRSPAQPADATDPTVADLEVSHVGGGTGAIHDTATADEQIRLRHNAAAVPSVNDDSAGR